MKIQTSYAFIEGRDPDEEDILTAVKEALSRRKRGITTLITSNGIEISIEPES